jgi:hypothetical protein
LALKLQLLVEFVIGRLLLRQIITLNAAKRVLLLHATAESLLATKDIWTDGSGLATKASWTAESGLATKASWTAESGLASKSWLCAERSSFWLTKHFLNCF